MTDGRVPLLVIGGFLGSGKTTLVNRLLAAGDGRRLTVLVNDFGAVNVDAALIAASGADTLTLSNGCVCCQIGGDLTDALIAALAREPRPDAIVIEASGVADPWPIAQVALADPALTLDGVVVLTDASMLLEQLTDPLLADTVRRQLEAADLLVLNHCDAATEPGLAELRAWLDAAVPATPRHETRDAQVPDWWLRGVAPRRHAERTPEPDPPEPPPEGRYGFSRPRHGEVFSTHAFAQHAPYDAQALRALLRAMPRGVVRLKGVVETAAPDGWAVLQFAGRRGSLRAWPAGRPRPDDAAVGVLVAIGAGNELPVQALDAALQAAERSLAAPAST